MYALFTDDPLCPLPLDAVGYVSKLWRKRDLNVYFMKSHPQEDTIMAWAAEWSKYCAIIFYQTSSPQNSDIRVDFNAGDDELDVNKTDYIQTIMHFGIQI